MASKDYANGNIYCVASIINDEVYVGSTTQPVSKRMVKHRSEAKTRPTSHFQKVMSDLNIENFYIELLEEYPCDHVEQLNRKEGEWIRQVATSNSNIQSRTRKEHEIDSGCQAKCLLENREDVCRNKKNIDTNIWSANERRIMNATTLIKRKSTKEEKTGNQHTQQLT